jgi:hypothetical protein
VSLQSVSSCQTCEIERTEAMILRPKGCVSYDIVSCAGLARCFASWADELEDGGLSVKAAETGRQRAGPALAMPSIG